MRNGVISISGKRIVRMMLMIEWSWARFRILPGVEQMAGGKKLQESFEVVGIDIVPQFPQPSRLRTSVALSPCLAILVILGDAIV